MLDHSRITRYSQKACFAGCKAILCISSRHSKDSSSSDVESEENALSIVLMPYNVTMLAVDAMHYKSNVLATKAKQSGLGSRFHLKNNPSIYHMIALMGK